MYTTQALRYLQYPYLDPFGDMFHFYKTVKHMVYQDNYPNLGVLVDDIQGISNLFSLCRVLSRDNPERNSTFMIGIILFDVIDDQAH